MLFEYEGEPTFVMIIPYEMSMPLGTDVTRGKREVKENNIYYAFFT